MIIATKTFGMILNRLWTPPVGVGARLVVWIWRLGCSVGVWLSCLELNQLKLGSEVDLQ
jgi:hypothetical protein